MLIGCRKCQVQSKYKNSKDQHVLRIPSHKDLQFDRVFEVVVFNFEHDDSIKPIVEVPFKYAVGTTFGTRIARVSSKKPEKNQEKLFFK